MVGLQAVQAVKWSCSDLVVLHDRDSPAGLLLGLSPCLYSSQKLAWAHDMKRPIKSYPASHYLPGPLCGASTGHHERRQHHGTSTLTRVRCTCPAAQQHPLTEPKRTP